MTERRPFVVAVLCTGVFLGAIDSHLVNVAFPDMLRNFPGSDLTRLSWVMTGYTTAFTAALLPAGGLADRFGARLTYLAGLVVFVVSGTLCAFAPTAETLIAARTVQGLGGGILTPLALALILPRYPAERRGAAIGLWSATQSSAVALGPSLGGLLVSTWGWRTIFLLHLPLGLVTVIGAWRALPPDKPDGVQGRRVPDLAGAGLLLAAIAMPALAIAQLREWGPLSPRTTLALAAGVVFSVLFTRRSLRHPEPAVDLRILRIGGTARANTAMFLFGLVMFTWTVTNALFLTGVRGFGEARAGLALTPGPIAQAVLAPVAGRLSGRLGIRPVALAGVVLLACAEVTLVAGSRHAAYLVVVLPAVLLASAGIAALITSLSAAAVMGMPADRLATGTAMSVTSRAFGAVIGVSGVAVVLAGGPRDATAGYVTIWTTMALVCALLGIVATRLEGRPYRSGT